MLEYIATGEPWNGEPINGFSHPLNIEQLWSEAELEYIGLRVRPPDPVPPPNIWDVAAERERRLQLGFNHDFKDERGVARMATTPKGMEGWDEVTKWSNSAIALGRPDDQLDILPETGPIKVTALEWQEVLQTATIVRQPLWAASFMLQHMDPIPEDYADDKWWPPNP